MHWALLSIFHRLLCTRTTSTSIHLGRAFLLIPAQGNKVGCHQKLSGLLVTLVSCQLARSYWLSLRWRKKTQHLKNERNQQQDKLTPMVQCQESNYRCRFSKKKPEPLIYYWCRLHLQHIIGANFLKKPTHTNWAEPASPLARTSLSTSPANHCLLHSPTHPYPFRPVSHLSLARFSLSLSLVKPFLPPRPPLLASHLPSRSRRATPPFSTSSGMEGQWRVSTDCVGHVSASLIMALSMHHPSSSLGVIAGLSSRRQGLPTHPLSPLFQISPPNPTGGGVGGGRRDGGPAEALSLGPSQLMIPFVIFRNWWFLSSSPQIQRRWRWRGGLGSDDGGAESWQRAEHEWRRHATVCSGSGGSSGFVFWDFWIFFLVALMHRLGSIWAELNFIILIFIIIFFNSYISKVLVLSVSNLCCLHGAGWKIRHLCEVPNRHILLGHILLVVWQWLNNSMFRIVNTWIELNVLYFR